ncbi:MAG: choice-of-anchor D domain-containing protein [Ignavibacteria bacterium]|nr:choice-of-anchor D domain-containing protein [Ignavibacteria bacterium]
MRWYFDKGNPRYDFIIHQYSKPSDFSFTLGNVDNVYTTPNGDLSIQIDNQLVEQKGLIAYQLLRGHTKKYIPCEFKVNNLSNGNWKVGFTVGTYDLSQELVIDPIVVGSFFGSIGNDKVNDIKVDELGYIYIGGTIFASNELPNTLNKSSYSQGKLINSKLDGFIAKFSPEGKNLVYYCTIGGSGDDEILSIDLDNSGGVIVGGYTYSDTSKGFPFTVGAPDSILTPGDADGFIAVIKEEGTRLGFCSYFGGERADTIKKIFIDTKSELLYIAGTTIGNSLPGKSSESFGGEDGFYAAISITNKQILYAYFLGGERFDAITDMEIFNGNIYVGGYTMSSDIAGLNNTYISGNDGFYAVANQSTGKLYYTHTYGGLGNDKVLGIAVDQSGTITIAGTSNSPTIDVSARSFAGAKIGGDDGFVAQFSPNSVLLFASLIGGSSDEEIFDVKVDKYGQIYLVGNTQGLMSVPNISVDADYITSLGGSECFLTVINPKDPLTYNYLTYFGGSSNDFCRSMALTENHIFCAGFSNSNDFRPLGGNSSQFKGGIFDGFFAIVDLPNRKPSLQPFILNFGKITVNSAGKVDSIVVKNRGFKPVTVKSTLPSSPFTLTKPTINATINPADSLYIVYKYQPLTTGMTSSNVAIHYGTVPTDELAIRLVGEGIASSITLHTESLDFGQVQVDSTKRMKISIINSGTAPGVLHFNKLLSSVFSYTSSTVPSDTTIGPGGQCQVELQFAPPAIGIFSDSFTVESNSVRLKCQLSGEGIVSQFRWTVDTLHIGNVRLGTPTKGSITLLNVGKAKGKITDIFLYGNKHFSLTPVIYPADSLIDSGDSISFVVTFLPTERGYETETIFANTPTGQLKAFISGNGVFPELKILTEESISFGNVAVNASKYDSVVFINEGDAPDTLYSARLSTIFTPFLLSGFPPKYVIAPKQKVIVYIKFSPLFAGSKRDTITVTCATTTFTTYVSGKGIDAQFKLTDTIRFGNTKVGSKNTQTVYIKNTGTAPGLVGNTYLIDTTNSYSLVGNIKQDFELAPNDSSPITIQFAPTSTTLGLKIATLSIRVDDKMLISSIRGESYGAIFESYPLEVSLDSAEVGTSTFGVVNVYNSGNISERPVIKLINDGESSFSILPITNPVKFRNKDTVQIKFTPSSAGIKSALLKIWGGINDTITVSIRAKGYIKIKPVPIRAEISMPDSMYASIGEQVTFPIVLRSLSGSYIEQIQSFTGTLRYNSTVLGVNYPTDSSLVIINDTAHLRIQGTVNGPKNGDTLAIVSFTVGLGNSSVTSIELNDFILHYRDSDTLSSTIVLPKSILTVNDIWSIEGKQRLYYASGKLTLELAPNTVHSSPITIKCLPYLPANTLMIYDATGRYIENLTPLLTAKGDISFSPQLLSKGCYFCVFQSGRHIAVRQFIVE